MVMSFGLANLAHIRLWLCPANSRSSHPKVNWRRLSGMRGKFVHRYFGMDWDIIEDVINNELPGLRSGNAVVVQDGRNLARRSKDSRQA